VVLFVCEPAILSLAYSIGGFICLVAYWPTIKDLYIHKKPSANNTTYAMFIFYAASAFLYSIFVLPNLLFSVMSAVNLICCTVVLVLNLKLTKELNAATVSSKK
jgi:hypothetical protein